jgi:hypothetical protein
MDIGGRRNEAGKYAEADGRGSAPRIFRPPVSEGQRRKGEPLEGAGERIGTLRRPYSRTSSSLGDELAARFQGRTEADATVCTSACIE